jgi:hypothetical protein
MSISISKDVLTQELFGLDSVGTRIWQLLNEGQDEVAIVNTLLDEYEVEREVLEKDISGLLNRLNEAGLIKIV